MSGHSKGRHTLSPRSRAKKVGGGAHSPRGGASASPTKGMDEDELLTYITSLTPEQKLTFLATEFFRYVQFVNCVIIACAVAFLSLLSFLLFCFLLFFFSGYPYRDMLFIGN